MINFVVKRGRFPSVSRTGTPGTDPINRIALKSSSISDNEKIRNFIPDFCAETQNRTVDTTIFSRMLYQLSYLGEPLFLNNVLYYTSFWLGVKLFANFVTNSQS